jgi:hypothetical protein
MSSPGAEERTVAKAGPPCRLLGRNGMFIFTDGTSNAATDDSDSGAFWCLKTMKGFGPDDDPVGVADCRNPARSCYEPT